MATCHSCQQHVDGRKAVRCDSCGASLHRDCAINVENAHCCDVCFTVSTAEPEHEPFELPEVIRRSHIETYRACPYKFYMEVVKGMECAPNIYTQVGTDVHQIVDAMCADTMTVQQATRAFNMLWNQYDVAIFEDCSALKEKLYDRAVTSLANAHKIISELGPPLSTEESLCFSVGESLPKISVITDRVDEVNGELEVIDWKTGGVMVGQKLANDLQAPLYIHGVQEEYQKPVRKLTFYYLNEGKVRTFERTHGEDYVCQVRKNTYTINLTEAIREVKRLFARMMKGDFNVPRETRKMYYTCKTCHIKEQEACQGADMEAWGQYNKGGF